MHVNLNVSGDGDGSGHLGLRVTPEAAQQHTQHVIEALALAVEHFRRRCEELEDEARRARVEGRREALREVEQKLRDAEWRVMQAQAKKKQAEQERERLETLLAQSRYKAAAASRRPAQGAPPSDDQRVFEAVLASADDELQLIRAELRTLADDLRGSEEGPDGGRIIRGETDPAPPVVPDRAPEAVTGTSVGSPALGTPRWQARAVSSTSQRATRTVMLGRRRRFLGRLFFVSAGLPMPVVGAAVRATFSQEPGVAVIWSILFPVSAVVLATMAAALLLLFARLAYAWGQDEGTHSLSCAFHAIVGVVTCLVGVALTPDTLPLLADCGRLFAEYLGPL
ncbi:MULTISPECIES: V-type ATP synthase subunit E [unclassified Streptomyces]|uniref:coiled-coil domain-containing protein n=1 Tax=unclassified Streptomyces TaxID=2593676 RepID=UPI003369C18B